MKLRDRVSLRIRTLRQRRELTQDELAERIGRTADAVSQLERGLSLPSFETLERLALALDVPVRDFFDSDTSDEGGAERTRLMATLVDIARQMPDKELAVAVQVLEAMAAKQPATSRKR